MERAHNEIKRVLSSNKNLMKDLTYEKTEDLTYLSQCFHESLRIEAPLPMQSSLMFTHDVNIKGHKIDAGEIVYVSMGLLHHDPT
jgi:cytochrome P450